MNVEAYLKFALAIGREAGVILLRMRESADFRGVSKKVFDLVFMADLEIDQNRSQISERWPSHSKEGAASGYRGVCPFWIIEPFDGTIKFASGHGYVAISIALSIGEEIVLGIVHAPAHSQTFHETFGGGAFQNGARMKVSGEIDPARAPIATGFPHDRTKIGRIVERLKLLLRVFGDVRLLAAPAPDISWVADGTLDAFLDRVYIWNVAAAGLIATEAGGKRVRVATRGGREAEDGEDFPIASPESFDLLRPILKAGEVL
jgi:myo-inositol-1(or 4)-monophosphatase